MESRPKVDDEKGDRRRRFQVGRATTSNAADNGRHRCNDSRTARGIVEPMEELSPDPERVPRLGALDDLDASSDQHPSDRPASQAHKVFHGNRPIKDTSPLRME